MPEPLDRLTAALAGRYRIERELGHGGMATVYLAEDLKHHRQVALKVLQPEVASALGPERFLREIQIAAGLTHPHILPLFDSGQAAGFLYYVMPYVSGESLRQRLERERQLAVDEAVRITGEVAGALDYAHRHGVIHRDIKPENILLHEGSALVADFGIALAIGHAGAERLTETGISVGTPAYMSPEQGSGERALDARSDIYSLGCVAYEMLAGEPPFTGASIQAVIAKRLAGPAPRVSVLRDGVPAAVVDAIARALARAPSDRFATAGDFARALGGRGRRAILKRRFAITGAVALVFVAGAAVAVARVPASMRATLRTLLTRQRAVLHATRIAVAPFENRSGDSALDVLGEMIADWVGTELANTAEFEVVDARTAVLTGRVVDRLPPFTRPRDRAIAIAREVGASKVVAGSFYREGDSLRFESRILDAATGNLLMTIPPILVPVARKLDGVGLLARQTVAALAASSDTLGRGGPAYNAPPSFEAYRALSGAWEAFITSGLRDTATLFDAIQESWRGDTAYFYPLVMQALILQQSSQWAHADSLLRYVAARKERLAPGSRVIFDALSATQTGDLEGTARNGLLMLRYSAASPEAVAFAAIAALRAERPSVALDILDRTDPARGVFLALPLYWTTRGDALHLLGRYGDEEANARLGRRQFPTNATLVYHQLRAAAARGRVGEVETILRAGFAGIRTTPQIQRTRALFAARELRQHGQAAAARRLFEEHLGSVAADTTLTPERRMEYLYDGGRYQAVRDLAQQTLARDPAEVDALGHLGAVAARAGDTTEARRVLGRLAALRRPYLFGQPALWRAHILALLGDQQAPLDLLRDAYREGCAFTRAGWDFYVHLYPDFGMLEGPEPYRAFLQTPSSIDSRRTPRTSAGRRGNADG